MRSLKLPARVFAQHVQRRAAGKPTPAVLVGVEVVHAWVDSLESRGLVRTALCSADEAACVYLDAEHVRGRLEGLVRTRVEAARAGRSSEQTSFERSVWADVSRDALLAAGDLDGHLLLGYADAGERSSPVRVFGAALRVLGSDAAALLVEPAPEHFDDALRMAISLAEAAPRAQIAVATTSDTWAAWQAMPDREHAKAIVRPCVVELPARDSLESARRLAAEARRSGKAADEELARSAAERALFDALEASAPSRGRFELNRKLNIDFGNRPLEIDLACTALRLAVEVDGYFHFEDADAYRRDRRKDVVLQREGYFVVRVLAEDVTARLADTLAIIHRAMAFQSESEFERRPEDES